MSKTPWIALLLTCLLACAPASDEGGDGLLHVVATTGMVADTARIVGGENVRVDALMGPGVDPHLYKASEGDVQRLSQADIILYNGLHLEGKMTDVLVKLAASRPVIPVAADIAESSLREPPEFAGLYDPHVWFNAQLWIETIAPITEALSAQDPANADRYAERAAAYREQLLELDRWTAEQIATIPEESRVLVTAHDAFGYFGERYGIRVVGIQGFSTLTEAGLGDIERVADVVVESKVRSVFIESSVSPRAIEAVLAACRQKGAEVSIGGELFSDALGAAGGEADNYVGMMRHNVTTIVAGLQ